MRGKRKKWIWKLVKQDNPVILAIIRNKYGERTMQMDRKAVVRVVKKMWTRKQLQHIIGWPK